jgi:hypothetical protein
LRHAVETGNIDVIRLFIERWNVSVTSRDLDGETPLSVARELYPEIAELLQKRVPFWN